MDLANMIIESKKVDIEYPGYEGLTFTLAHLTRDELKSIRKKATKSKRNPKSRQIEDEVDSDLFQDLYIKSVIVGWSGFKLKYLEEMMPIDVSGLSDDEYLGGEGLFEYSKEQASVLMQNASGIDEWVTDELGDIGNFT